MQNLSKNSLLQFSELFPHFHRVYGTEFDEESHGGDDNDDEDDDDLDDSTRDTGEDSTNLFTSAKGAICYLCAMILGTVAFLIKALLHYTMITLSSPL